MKTLNGIGMMRLNFWFSSVSSVFSASLRLTSLGQTFVFPHSLTRKFHTSNRGAECSGERTRPRVQVSAPSPKLSSPAMQEVRGSGGAAARTRGRVRSPETPCTLTESVR